MRKVVGVVWKLALLVVLVGGGVWAVARMSGCGRESAANAPTARIEQVRKGPFTVSVRESGTLEALTSVEVKSNVEGPVIKLNVDEGDVVQKGDVLLQIDPKQIREEVRQAEANYEAAKAQLERATEATLVTKRGLDAQLEQAIENERAAEAALESVRQGSVQQISQAETDLSTSKDSLERDKIALSQAQIALQQLEINLNQMRANLDSAKVDYDNAQRELSRSEELFAKQYLSKKALEDAQARASSTKAAFENAQKNVENQKKAIESQKATIEAQRRVIRSRETTLTYQTANLETLKASRKAAEQQAEANLKSRRSQRAQIEQTIESQKKMAELAEASARAAELRMASTLKTAKERLSWTTVIAPMSGTVTDLRIEEGEILTSGRSAFSSGPPIMTIADLSTMIVRLPINEVDMGQVAVGQRAEISVSAFPNRKFEGRVRQIAPSGSVQDNIVRFDVEVEVVGSSSELMPGMTADVDVFVVDREDVLQVPIEAVQEQDSFAIMVTLKPDEVSKLKVRDAVELETRFGKKVAGRVKSVDTPVVVDLTGETRGWRPGPVEFSLVLPSGETIRSLSGRVIQSKSYYVEVPEAEGAKAKPARPSPSAGGPSRSQAGPPGRGGAAPLGRKVPIEVGLKNEGFYEVLSGIEAGQQVLIRPPSAEKSPFGR